MKNDHFHLLVAGLVYPSFLGAFIFELAQNYSGLNSTQVVLAICLLLHYSGDFLFTADDERRSIYCFVRMVLDLAIVVFIYSAMTYVLKVPAPDNFSRIWLLLAAFKVTAVMWEWSGPPDKNRSQATIADFLYIAAYFSGWLFFSDITILLAVVLLIDSLSYFFWESLANSSSGNN